MRGIYFLFFTILVEHCFSHVPILQRTLANIQNIRFKREDVNGLPPEFKRKPIQDALAKVDETHTFVCKVRGVPKPFIIWYHGDEILFEDEKIRIKKYSMTIRNLKKSDSGKYACQAFNKHGVIWGNFSLQVKENEDLNQLDVPFCIKSLNKRTFLLSGNSLRLEFETDVSLVQRGNKVMISLVHDKDRECERNHQILIGKEHEEKCFDGQDCTTNMCQNGGTCVRTGSTHTCKCPEGLQEDDCSPKIGEPSSHNLTFVVVPQDRFLKRDKAHTEECSVEVPPGEEVQYDWTLNGVLVEDYDKSSGFGSLPGGILQIDKFTDTLEGEYSCFATTSSSTAEHTFKYKIVEENDDALQCDSSITDGVEFRIMNYDAEGTDCFYRITAPGDKVIELKVKMLNFGSASCEEESVVVYEGLSNQGVPLETICSDDVFGQIRPYHVSTLFIEYKNPLQQKGERFVIEYSFVEDNFTPAPVIPTTPSPVGGQNDCSRLYKDIETDTGDLIYTAPEYENNKECTIVVRNTLLPGHVVQIQFLYFEIEDSDNCTCDSLKIMSGERAESAMLGGPYCGKSLHGRTFLTSGNSLRLEFKTDVTFALKGFKARISFVPSEECECDRNQVCIRQDYEKKCIRGQQCTSNACKNGGTCIKKGSTQTCYCATGFQGDVCSTQTGETLTHHLTFTVAPHDRSLKRDNGHTEECAVNVLPGEEVQYDWTFNGVLIEAYNQRSGFGSHPGGVLQIDKFTDTLEGQYSCFATTSSCTAEHTFEYRIVENCDVRIYPGPQSEIKKINENALMRCHVDSRAKEVRWKKNGVYIDFNKNERYKQMVNNYLLIKNIGMSDEGTYRCEAEDSYGCLSYKEGTLTVIDIKSLNDYCGISIHDEVAMASSRISMGNDAKPKDHPWHVTFRSRGNSRRHISFCGGTVISQTYILTAANCIKEFEERMNAPWAPENVLFKLGTTSCLGDRKGTTRTFKSYTVHPGYGARATYDNDIALIELESAVEYTDAIRPICLEPSDYNDRVFLEHSGSHFSTPGKVAGCGNKRKIGGLTDVLQEIYLPYVHRDECVQSLGSLSNRFTDRMFCAGSNVSRKGDTCGGDTGGGLVMAATNRWVQTGIVSWGLGCDVNRFYGYYTDVGKFYDWIEGITKFSEEEVPAFLLD